MRKPWIFTGNTFNRATKRSHKKMLTIATDTDSKLQGRSGDPVVNDIYLEYNPVFVAYRDISAAYNYATGTRKGKTLNIVTLLKVNMKQNLPLWEGKIRSVYAQGTPEEMEYFPHGRAAFMEGTYEQRIQAVRVLGERLADDSSAILSAYAPTVQNFYSVLLAARNTQQQDEGTVEELSTARENQRVVLAKALYTVLSKLMAHFHNDTAQISNFFDLALIRTKPRREPVPTTGFIVRGKITENTTPIAGATVVLSKGMEPLFETTTNDRGDYVFEEDNVAPTVAGFTRLTVTAEGYLPNTRDFALTLGQEYKFDLTLAVMLLRAA